MLEGGDAALDHFGHILAHLVGPVRDAHVIGVVGTRGLRAAVPVGPGVHQRLALAGDAEVNDHGRAAGQGRARTALVVICCAGAHEGHVEMRVRINAAGDNVAALGVNGFAGCQPRADGGDDLALNQHVGLVGAVRGNDRAALDDC